MIKAIGWCSLLGVIMVGGFYFEYRSLDPCEWMTQEMTRFDNVGGVTGLGSAAGHIMAKGECLTNWMDLRVKEAEAR